MKLDNEHQYDDIINLPHHVSSRRPHMDPIDRAAQFSPFAALTGHDEAIKETARLTDQYMELDENTKELLNRRLQIIREHLSEKPEIFIIYFDPDEKKSGGSYINLNGKVKKIDEFGRRLILENDVPIQFDQIYGLEVKIFRN